MDGLDNKGCDNMQNYIAMNRDIEGNNTIDEKSITNKKWILDYKINREQHYVEITQWNGRTKKIYFRSGGDKDIQQTLDKMQKEQFINNEIIETTPSPTPTITVDNVNS